MSDYDYIKERSLSFEAHRQINAGLSSYGICFDYRKIMTNHAINYTGGLSSIWCDKTIETSMHDFHSINRYLNMFKYGIRYIPRKRPKKNS
jgi:hypothetical protein